MSKEEDVKRVKALIEDNSQPGYPCTINFLHRRFPMYSEQYLKELIALAGYKHVPAHVVKGVRG